MFLKENKHINSLLWCHYMSTTKITHLCHHESHIIISTSPRTFNEKFKLLSLCPLIWGTCTFTTVSEVNTRDPTRYSDDKSNLDLAPKKNFKYYSNTVYEIIYHWCMKSSTVGQLIGAYLRWCYIQMVLKYFSSFYFNL